MRWTDLPFRNIWCVDTEFYPGPGLANGGREGDPSTPLCLVAKEMRTGRIVQQWQDEFGPFPPYSLDSDTLVIGYMISAEFGTHIALGWGQPACCLDPYIEFHHLTNDGRIKSGDREKDSTGLMGRCATSARTRSTSRARSACAIEFSKGRRSPRRSGRTSSRTARTMSMRSSA